MLRNFFEGRVVLPLLLLSFAPVAEVVAQTSASASAPLAASAATAVPALVPFTGTLSAPSGAPLASEAIITFLVFKDQTGGEPLFSETQIVSLDAAGHYKIQLGATLANGLPAELFATGEARWIEAQPAGQAAQPRTLIASVPYALKAADAETLGGLPVSAFALTGTVKSGAFSTGKSPDTVSDVTTTGGAAGYIPEFSGAATVVNSPIFVSGSNVGIGTTTPNALLSVGGNATVDGSLSVSGNSLFFGSAAFENAGTATKTQGYASRAVQFLASGYNSATSKVVNSTFLWQSEPVGNNTASPSATLNLLSSTTSAAPTETGFHFNANGTINFAPGQSFPAAGINGLTVNSPLTTTASGNTVTLGLNTAALEATLNAVYPTLGGANKFSGNNNFAGIQSFNSIGVGTSTPRTMVELSQNALNAIGPILTLTNKNSVGTGAATAIDFNSVNPPSGTYNPTSRIEALNDNDSDDLLFESNTPGKLADGLRANMVIKSSGLVGIGTTSPGSPLSVQGAANWGVAEIVASASNGEATIGFRPSNVAKGAQGDWLVGTDPSSVSTGSFVIQNATVPDLSILPTGQILVNPTAALSQGFALDHGQLEVAPVSGGNALYGITAIGGQDAYGDGYEAVLGTGAMGTGTGLGGEGGIFNGGDSENYFAGYGAQFFGGEGGAASQSGGGGYFVGGASGNGYGGDGADIAGGYTYGAYPGGYGIYVSPGYSINSNTGADTNNYAGYFAGDVEITGSLNGQGPLILKTDDPADPANKYLSHAAVASSEQMNIYTGNVVTDDLGLATVKLPSWFQAENSDFRYQLTVIGGRFAQAIVSKEIENNQFAISTNASNVKVSWQITAVRQDAYAQAHPLAVEQEKPANERGYYLSPELFGQPQEKQTEWGRRPQQMQRMKQLRDKQEQARLAKSNKTPVKSQ